ncbi:MAG: dienelactone hydrolase family protein [Myxococcales bacterium]|nr:dienelactone hydrolase family protein [Myxococcales bacterium]
MNGLERFERTSFSALHWTRDVYRAGSGPGVLVMHEVPGLHPRVIEFGQRLVDAGFSVAMPDLLGVAGRTATPLYNVGSMLRACIAREFAVLASHRASPITEWLRVLGRALHAEAGGPGIGAVGMCLTGNFALALMVDEHLLAPVLSQPSLPFPLGRARKAALHIAPEQLEQVKARARAGACVLGLRFTGDPLVPAERFATLRRELGDAFEAIEIDSKRGNPHGIARTAHSVLAFDLVDEPGHPTREALERVIAFFDARLRQGS